MSAPAGVGAGGNDPEVVAPGIFAARGRAPYNLGLIAVDHGVIAVDVPPTPVEARQWQAWVEANVGPIRYVILTDARPERLVSAALWKVPLVALGETARRLAVLDDRAWAEIVQTVGRGFPQAEYGKLRPRRAMLSAESRLHLHGRPGGIELWGVSGTAPGSIFIAVPEAGVLFTGDTVMLDEPPVLDLIPDWEAWQQTLVALNGEKALRRLVPGRGKGSAHAGELESLLEFLHTSQKMARSLARLRNSGPELGRAAQDLVDSFFPRTASRTEALRRVRRVLELEVAACPARPAAVSHAGPPPSAT